MTNGLKTERKKISNNKQQYKEKEVEIWNSDPKIKKPNERRKKKLRPKTNV